MFTSFDGGRTPPPPRSGELISNRFFCKQILRLIFLLSSYLQLSIRFYVHLALCTITGKRLERSIADLHTFTGLSLEGFHWNSLPMELLGIKAFHSALPDDS